MKYYSTSRQAPVVDFREATIRGQAPDKGLYFPETIPQVDAALLDRIGELSDEEIAYRVIRPYTGAVIREEELFRIVQETVSFPIPLVQVQEDIYSLELFHGPTLAFKDIGARFMSRCLGYFVQEGGPLSTNKITVLVATSGDTGGAVANGFYQVEGVDVVILYPSGKVSPVQEKQLTSPGQNIHALEVAGTFDDCQSLVKQAFADPELADRLFLTSANSINVARWLPQQFYYFFAYKQWADKEHPPVISVPSGNFGNICAGLLALQSGLPVRHFIAACNMNDIVSDYLETEQLRPKTAIPTLSNAMDVGNPSNFVRILELFGHRFPDLKERLSAATITDDETEITIGNVFRQQHYLTDPHGAVGYLALLRYLSVHREEKGIFLETAHPVKFPEAVERITGQPVALPAAFLPLMEAEKRSTFIRPNYADLKEYLWNKS